MVIFYQVLLMLNNHWRKIKMKYKIYELVEPDILSKTEPDGYDIKTTNKTVLQELDWGFGNNLGGTYSSLESAKEEITDNLSDLKGKKLTILPILDIDWEGNLKN